MDLGECFEALVKVGAVGDIHSPKYLEQFKASLLQVNCRELDLFLLAGDLILKGAAGNAKDVLKALEQNNIGCPIVGCFGNEEYSDIRGEVRKTAGDKIRFLDDESIVIRLRDTKVGIVGSQGSLDSPTSWQSRNIPNIDKIYSERIDRVSELLATLEADIRILLTHYPPTYRVLRGERKVSYPHIGCSRCERIISNEKVDVVVSAHSHMGIPFAVVNNVPVYNVSLLVSRKISVVDIYKAKTLDQYL